MNLPQSFFKPGTYELTSPGRNNLKEFIQNQELFRFRDLVGFTPHPNDTNPPPWPWPWPILRSRRDILFSNVNQGMFNNTYPDPNDDNPWPWPLGPLVRDIVNDKIFDLIQNSPKRDNTYNLIDVIKREGIALEAITDLSNNISDFQKSLSTKLDCLK